MYLCEKDIRKIFSIKERIQMQKKHFEMETDGFYGTYWKCKTDSDCAMIAMKKQSGPVIC